VIADVGASIEKEDLPKCIWNGEILFLPVNLSDVHRGQLVAMGMLDAYLAKPDKASAIGGDSSEAASDHFVWRFLNSAARAQYVCADPVGVNQAAKNLLLEQLTDGAVQILDIAAGHGAGTLSILSFIASMREQSKLPKLPLNVAVTALDFSADALATYQQVAEELREWLGKQGITLSVDVSLVDMRLQGELSQALDTFFADARTSGCKRFLCVLSAISGVGPEMISEMQGSFQEIASRIGNQPGGSWVWIEPPVSGKWLETFITGIFYTLKKVKHKLMLKGGTFGLESADSTFPGSSSPPSKFKWRDPHVKSDLTSRVQVLSASVGK
jgi:hypothetical protein